ncbi:MAG: hypothetical protein ACI8TX_002288 [Hyphomicrobiaceae bacterium]|jgi:hypothetical protein
MRTYLLTGLGLCLAMTAACGEGTLEFGGDRDNTKTIVTVRGNVDDIIPVTTRDIVVFVFTNLRDPGTFRDFDDGEIVVLATGSSEFTVPDVDRGDITVIFLLDEAGNNADGQIDEGDPIATLDDPDNELDDVRSGLTIEARDIDINFTDEPSGNLPAAGVAEADDIQRLSESSP